MTGGDWAEQARRFQRTCPVVQHGEVSVPEEGTWEPPGVDSCPVTGGSMADVFGVLMAAGLSLEEVAELERLENRDVRRRLGTSAVDINHTDRATVVTYLEAWADLLEERLREQESRTSSELPLAAE